MSARDASTSWALVQRLLGHILPLDARHSHNIADLTRHERKRTSAVDEANDAEDRVQHAARLHALEDEGESYIPSD